MLSAPANGPPSSPVPLKHVEDTRPFAQHVKALGVSPLRTVAESLHHVTTPKVNRTAEQWKNAMQIIIRYHAYIHLVGELNDRALDASKEQDTAHDEAWQAAQDDSMNNP